MNNKAIEGQLAFKDNPGKAQEGLIDPEAIETILGLLMSGEKPYSIAKRMNVTMTDIEKIRSLSANVTLQQVRTWHNQAFIGKTWEVIHAAMNRIAATIDEASAVEAANIVTKLYDKQLLSRIELAASLEPHAEDSEEDMQDQIRKWDNQLREEGIHIYDADFEDIEKETPE